MFNCCKKTKRKRAIPSKIDSVNLREFEQAATSADIDKVCKDLKEKKDDINKHPCKATEKNQHGAVKLEQAAASADIDKVCKDLKEKKDDINKHPCKATEKNQHGAVKLEQAAASADIEKVCKDLKERKDDINKDLFKATEKNDYEKVKILLENEASVNQRSEFSDSTPLVLAVKNNYGEMSMLLIEFGSDVNARDKYNDSPLLLAIENNNAHLAEELIAHGADINVKDSSGQTVLLVASEGLPTLIPSLITKGLDVNAVDTRTNSNALHKVIKHMDTHVFDSGAINAINALLDAGCDASLKTKDGVTPLMVAMTNDFSRFDFEPTEYNRYFREQMSNTFEKFITKCNNLDSENKNGETALMWAAEMGLLHHVKTLVERGCSIDKQSCSKWTALRFAVVSDEPGVLEVVKYLLDQGADYEVIDNEGSSPIQEAFFSDSEIIELFLRYGCRIDFSLINFDKLMNSIISRMIPLDILETMYWYGSCSETDVLRCLENPKFILCCEPKYHKRANWLSELCSKPRTLKSNCRIAIRHCLQKALGLEKMNLLPVPSKIRQYLNHEINDEIFIDESQSEPELIEEKFEYRNIDDFYRWADQFGYF